MNNVKIILLSILSLVLILAFSWGLGWFGIFYKGTVGVTNKNLDREIFKQSKSYVEGMGNDLAKFKYELTTEKDLMVREAIVDLIINKYGDFDVNKLDNPDLRSFLLDVKNGKYNE